MKKITIEVTEEQHKEILSIIKPKTVKPWRAEPGGKYFFKSTAGYVDSAHENQDSIDNHRYLIGNYFQTEEEAEASLERDKAIGRVTHRIIELNDGWEAETKKTMTKLHSVDEIAKHLAMFPDEDILLEDQMIDYVRYTVGDIMELLTNDRQTVKQTLLERVDGELIGSACSACGGRSVTHPENGNCTACWGRGVDRETRIYNRALDQAIKIINEVL